MKAPHLAYLNFQHLEPSPVLRPFVWSFWTFRQERLAGFSEEYMHSSGGFGLVFNFGDAPTLDAKPLTEPVFLDGANTRSRRMGFVGKVDLLGIRFAVGQARPFLGLPLSELCDTVALLEALRKPDLLALHGRLSESSRLSERVGLLEAWLMNRLTTGKTSSALIPISLAHLRQQTLPIPQLAQELGVSQRQLERLYAAQVGMSPKHYARLVRVDGARVALKGAQSAAGVAVDYGFYDQSHFIREFSAVVGMTPAAYANRSK